MLSALLSINIFYDLKSEVKLNKNNERSCVVQLLIDAFR